MYRTTWYSEWLEAFRTTGDDNFLALARELFARVESARLIGSDWKQGRLGCQLAELRLSEPDEIDLPGLPLEITPLCSVRPVTDG